MLGFLQKHVFPIAVALTVATATYSTVAVATTGSLTGPFRHVVSGFDLYEPPDSMTILWDDYKTGPSSGTSSQTPTNWPTPYAQLPYRTVFIGAEMPPNSNSSYVINYGIAYVVFSRQPAQEYLRFSYRENRAAYGYLHASTLSPGNYGYKSGEIQDWIVLQTTWATAGQYKPSMKATIDLTNATYWNNEWSIYGGFDFDFYYPCCGNNDMPGVRGISDCPYPYILTCKDPNGSGGGSEWGSESSGGSSSGGGSSGGGSSGGGSSGGSSGGGGDISSSKPPWPWDPDGSGSSSSAPDPWEDDSYPDVSISIPDGELPGGEGNTGEDGYDWELPGWGSELPDYNPDYIPEMPELNWPEIPYPDFGFPEIPDPGFEFPEIPDPDFEFPGFDDDIFDDGGWSWPPPFPSKGGWMRDFLSRFADYLCPI